MPIARGLCGQTPESLPGDEPIRYPVALHRHDPVGAIFPPTGWPVWPDRGFHAESRPQRPAGGCPAALITHRPMPDWLSVFSWRPRAPRPLLSGLLASVLLEAGAPGRLLYRAWRRVAKIA